MNYLELVQANSETRIDQNLYGQPKTLNIKYQATYHKIGEMLNESPNILNNLCVSGLGSTNSLYSLINIFEQIKNKDSIKLEKYNLFELGRGKATTSFALIRDIQIPIFNRIRIPIYLVKEDILNVDKHLFIAGKRGINFLDFDSCSSLTSFASQKLERKLLSTINSVLQEESIIHLNFVIKSFRVKSNYEDFTIKLTSLIDKIRQNFIIEKDIRTQYETIQGRGVKTYMGGTILKLRRRHVR